MNNPTIKETDKSFKVITAAFNNFGKLLIINSKSINTPLLYLTSNLLISFILKKVSNKYIEINAFLTGSFAIGIISGAYSTEVFRGAIQSIDKGQFEAAKVLGLNKFKQFYKIILPQMLRLAIPNLSNVWQITLKDTSLISVTGLVEIMRQSYIAAGSTRDPLFFYSFAAVLSLLLTFLSMKLINKLEVKYSKGY